MRCKYVIHTVGPRWNGGQNGEEELLRSCYRNSLDLAKKYDCESIAFPLISAGVYHYPKDKALGVAVEEITDFLTENEMDVYITIFDKSSFQISEKLFDDITSYIDDKYVEEHSRLDRRRRLFFNKDVSLSYEDSVEIIENTPPDESGCVYKALPSVEAENSISLDEALEDIDESFSEMLLRKIDEKGMTDAECYKKANIDRKLFSKIRSNRQYKPSKVTALAFCISLELSLDETKDMLMKAGYALSHSNKFDIIIEYFIKNQNYNIFEINEALFAFDQVLLGA